MHLWDSAEKADFLLCQGSLQVDSAGLGVDVAHLCTMLEALGFIRDACKPFVIALASSTQALGVGGQKELKVILCYGAVEFEVTLHYMRPGFKPRNKILTECSRAGS